MPPLAEDFFQTVFSSESNQSQQWHFIW